MLRAEGVDKRYGELRALRGVSLHAERGRTTVLIGPSGCGESTLLRVLIGLIAPDGGQVTLFAASSSSGCRLARAAVNPG